MSWTEQCAHVDWKEPHSREREQSKVGTSGGTAQTRFSAKQLTTLKSFFFTCSFSDWLALLEQQGRQETLQWSADVSCSFSFFSISFFSICSFTLICPNPKTLFLSSALFIYLPSILPLLLFTIGSVVSLFSDYFLHLLPLVFLSFFFWFCCSSSRRQSYRH